MTFTVRELQKAKADKQAIVTWLHERSPQGAFAWLAAYDETLGRLTTCAGSLAKAHEHRDLEMDVKHSLFKTRSGRVYRALLIIEGSEVFILRVRGPGQTPVEAGDLEVLSVRAVLTRIIQTRIIQSHVPETSAPRRIYRQGCR